MGERCVLLVTRRGDAEATGLACSLRRVGVPVRRLDCDGLDGVAVTVEAGGALTVGGVRCLPTVTWLRHFSMRAAPGPGDAAGRMLHRDSWTALVRQLSVVSGAVIGGVEPGRLQQRARALALGVRTPRGLVTTDPGAVAAHCPRGRYVVKVLDRHFVEPEPGELAWFLPRIVDRGSLADGAPPFRAGAPVVVEEYVAHEREMRVYAVGGEVHAFEVVKDDPGDIWSRPDRVRVRAVDAPAPVADAVGALSRAWDLTYGAFDFLLDGGEPVFLEVNVHGDWNWFERKAGVTVVSDAVARTVRDLHRSLVAAGTGRPAPAAPVDLLTFLGAGQSAR